MDYLKKILLLFVSAAAIGFPLCERVNAAGGWVDISGAMKKALGPDSIPPSELYLKHGFPSNVKSVSVKGVTYKRVVLSWPTGSTTIKRDLLLDCSSYSYKENDGNPGYWYALDWVFPDNLDRSVDAMAFMYFCAASKNPWQLLAVNSDDEKYYLNNSAAYQLPSKKYGKMYTWVVAKVGKYGMAEAMRLYLACGAKKVGFYSLYDAAGDQGIILEEANPGSIGESIIQDVC
jgi:hypothetical protein